MRTWFPTTVLATLLLFGSPAAKAQGEACADPTHSIMTHLMAKGNEAMLLHAWTGDDARAAVKWDLAQDFPWRDESLKARTPEIDSVVVLQYSDGAVEVSFAKGDCMLFVLFDENGMLLQDLEAAVKGNTAPPPPPSPLETPTEGI